MKNCFAFLLATEVEAKLKVPAAVLVGPKVGTSVKHFIIGVMIQVVVFIQNSKLVARNTLIFAS